MVGSIRDMRKQILFGLALTVFLLTTAESCDPRTPQQQAADQAANEAAQRRAYIPTHDIEFKNYNERQKLADNPTTILWCTSAFPVPSSPLFTIPIVGKLTSSTKRPFDSNPGPDGMYGSSDPYRYGFTPGGQYVDFSNMQTFCTTEPTVWQRQTTAIVVKTDDRLLTAQKEAQAALAAGDKAKAQDILIKAMEAK